MVFKKKEKKAGMELSLNLIIMLLIGLVVLGLVITFVKNMMNKSSNIYQQELDQNDEAMLKKVLEEPGNFAILPKRVRLKRNQLGRVYIKIRNTGDDEITIDSGSLMEATNTEVILKSSAGDEINTGFTLSGPGFSIDSGEQEAEAYDLKLDQDPGIYYLTVTTNELSERITIIVE